ncbi:MAG: glycoside hydrolase family 127 protein, partial [Thermoguttaceae bacterium]|nr:glycoside hydrolase family 127 protein [Thermoguttaceae bacterium]
MQKKTPLLLLVAFLLTSSVPAAEDVVKATRKIEPFALNQVRLTPSPFKTAQEKDCAYLLSVNPDSLLANFRSFAGLEPKAKHYDGWESATIAGHSLGHYLAAVSSAYASTGNEKFKEISDYIVAELAACQEAADMGLVTAVPAFSTVFDEISRGDIRTQGFDLNGLWVPLYTLHKIMNGLMDAYHHCDKLV